MVALGLLGLILKLLPKCAAGLRIWLGTRWPVVLRRVPAVLRPPQPPHYPFFRCSGSEKHFAPVTRERGTCTSITQQGGCLEDTSDEGVATRAAPSCGLPVVAACGGAGSGQQGDGSGRAATARWTTARWVTGSMGMGSKGMAKQMVMENGKYSDKAFIDAMVPTTRVP